MRKNEMSRPGYLVVGIIIGLVIGLNVKGIWPQVPLHATATVGLDKFAIATGMVHNGVEALYFLDYLTGDLRAAVLNPKNGKFNAFFTHNIAKDFGGVNKNPRYLMVTGQTQMPRGRAGFQYADSTVYIAEGEQWTSGCLLDSLELQPAGRQQASACTIPTARSDRDADCVRPRRMK